jgi:hypothetical protein
MILIVKVGQQHWFSKRTNLADLDQLVSGMTPWPQTSWIDQVNSEFLSVGQFFNLAVDTSRPSRSMRTGSYAVETARLFSSVAYCCFSASRSDCAEWEDEDSKDILFGHFSGFF